MNRRQYKIAQAAAQDTLCRVSRDLGREHHRMFPDQLMVAVAREAALLHPDNKEAQLAYMQGYAEARRQRDAYEQGE